jgi:transketolase
MENPFSLADAELKARARAIRKRICMMNAAARSGHTGGDMSEVDILVALYFRVMRYRADPLAWHDEFVLSKGHGVGGLYCCFAELGWVADVELTGYLRDHSRLPGHPVRQKLPGYVTVNTGALGHGLPIAAGLALAKRRRPAGTPAPGRVFVLTGDGELEEGSNWEALMAASHFGLDNLVVIVDRNHLQLADTTKKIMDLEPLDRKFAAFGMEVHETNGNDPFQISILIENMDFHNGKPKAVIAQTVKGRGVSFMENVAAWHHKYPNEDELALALKELDHA